MVFAARIEPKKDWLFFDYELRDIGFLEKELCVYLEAVFDY